MEIKMEEKIIKNITKEEMSRLQEMVDGFLKNVYEKTDLKNMVEVMKHEDKFALYEHYNHKTSLKILEKLLTICNIERKYNISGKLIGINIEKEYIFTEDMKKDIESIIVDLARRLKDILCITRGREFKTIIANIQTILDIVDNYIMILALLTTIHYYHPEPYAQIIEELDEENVSGIRSKINEMRKYRDEANLINEKYIKVYYNYLDNVFDLDDKLTNLEVENKEMQNTFESQKDEMMKLKDEFLKVALEGLRKFGFVEA